MIFFFFTETTVVHNYENMLAAFIVIQAMKGSKQSSLHGPMILVDPIHFTSIQTFLLAFSLPTIHTVNKKRFFQIGSGTCCI